MPVSRLATDELFQGVFNRLAETETKSSGVAESVPVSLAVSCWSSWWSRDGIGNIPPYCSAWHYPPSYQCHSGSHWHKNHPQIHWVCCHYHPSPCPGSRQVCQQQDPVWALMKLYMCWNWEVFAKSHGDASKMGTPVWVVLERDMVSSIGHGKEGKDEPIRFDNALPSSTSSNFRPASVCPSFPLNNQYSFHNLEKADEYELKDKEQKHTVQDSYQWTSYSYHHSQQNCPALLCQCQQRKQKAINLWNSDLVPFATCFCCPSSLASFVESEFFFPNPQGSPPTSQEATQSRQLSRRCASCGGPWLVTAVRWYPLHQRSQGEQTL